MKIFRLILVLGFLLLSSSSLTAQAVYVDQPAVCFECHADFQDLLKKKYVHAAFESGTCSECHNPHASKHASLLGEDVLTLCTSCHETINTDLQKQSAHLPALQGKCTTCHNPHASDYSALQQSETIDLCTSCHVSVTDWLTDEVVHAPVMEGDCLACHGPHGEVNNKLLKKSIPKICYDCHDSQDEINAAHKGYDISNANCIACHDPHSSKIANLLRPNQHAPFKSGNCKVCHETTGGNAFALKTSNKKLCTKCHSKVINDDLLFHHNVDDDKSCMNCHNPHASSSDNLLRDIQSNLCMSCHFNDESSQNKAKYITHDGIDCSNCHLPHGANNKTYLKSLDAELCTGCHEGSHDSSHPLGNDVIDPRNKKPVTCLSCHKLHGADFKKYLPLDPSMDLCIQCHKQ